MPKTKIISIFELKPTQFALGMLEVVEKAEGISKMSKREQKKYVKENPIAVVIAPNREHYIIDGHHHTSACWQAGIKKIHFHVVHDFSDSDFSYVQFWRNMRLRSWCHLFDKFGDGPREPLYLGTDIRALADDPYRSLAWLVRRNGGFERSPLPFSQFLWANFFRKYELFPLDFDLDYDLALKRALRLARSKEARRLPGFKGRAK